MRDSEIIQALLTRLAALGLTGDPTIAEFDGDDRCLNQDAVFPHVAVDVSDGDFDPNEESPPMVTVWETWGIEVIVSTEDKPGQVRGAYAEGRAILGEIRAGLNGYLLLASSGSTENDIELQLVSQRRTLGAAGVFEWIQTYRLKALSSGQIPE